MFEKILNWIGVLLVDFLFGTLFKVIHVYRLSKPLRIMLATLVISSYVIIEIFLIYMATFYWHIENNYLMFLCIVAAVIFVILVITGYLYQRKYYLEENDI